MTVSNKGRTEMIQLIENEMIKMVKSYFLNMKVSYSNLKDLFLMLMMKVLQGNVGQRKMKNQLP